MVDGHVTWEEGEGGGYQQLGPELHRPVFKLHIPAVYNDGTMMFSPKLHFVELLL